MILHVINVLLNITKMNASRYDEGNIDPLQNEHTCKTKGQ